MAGFRLSKWYLDVIGDDGALAIAYVARLGYGALSIDYASLLSADASGKVDTRTSLRRANDPVFDGARFAWAAPALSLAAQGIARAPSVAATLLESDAGSVVWTCHAPAADVLVTVDGRELRGLGYFEHVELTVPPWKLPLQELRWGRAISANDSVVWIDWREDGSSRARLAARRGVVIPEVTVEHDSIRDGAGSALVHMSDHVTLRRGTIGETALSILGRDLRARFPGKALLVDEHKERSRAELASGERGFAIHEVVVFP